MQEIIENAIHTRQVLRLTYDDRIRVVKPAALGFSSTRNLNLRVFQIQGTAASEQLGWKMFTLEKIKGLEKTGDSFTGVPEGYQLNDSALNPILAQLTMPQYDDNDAG